MIVKEGREYIVRNGLCNTETNTLGKIKIYFDNDPSITTQDTKIDLEKTGGFGQEGFGNVTNINMWDISCINK